MVCSLIGRETMDIDFVVDSEESERSVDELSDLKLDETNTLRLRLQSLSPPASILPTPTAVDASRAINGRNGMKTVIQSNHNPSPRDSLNIRRMSQSFQYSLHTTAPLATFEAERFELVNTIWSRLFAGAKIGFSNSVYLSEKSTGHRNYALGHFMYEQNPVCQLANESIFDISKALNTLLSMAYDWLPL